MGQSSYSVADSFLASQEIYDILWHPVAHHRVNNSSPLASILIQLKHLHALPSQLYKIFQMGLSCEFPHQNPTHSSFLQVSPPKPHYISLSCKFPHQNSITFLFLTGFTTETPLHVSFLQVSPPKLHHISISCRFPHRNPITCLFPASFPTKTPSHFSFLQVPHQTPSHFFSWRFPHKNPITFLSSKYLLISHLFYRPRFCRPKPFES